MRYYIIFWVFSCFFSIFAQNIDNVPLRLALTANSQIMFAQDIPTRKNLYGRPVYNVELIPFKLTFSNVSNASIFINVYDLFTSHLEMQIDGSTTDSVKKISMERERMLKPPTENDIIKILPGEQASVILPTTWYFSEQLFSLNNTGNYKIKIRYSNYPRRFGPLFINCWNGIADSNTMTLKVLPEGETAANGLRMSANLTQNNSDGRNNMLITSYMRNTSDLPITINPWDVDHEGLQMMDKNNKPLPFQMMSNRSRELRDDEKTLVIPPHEYTTFSLPCNYYKIEDPENAIIGGFSVTDRSGMVRIWNVNGSSANLKIKLNVKLPADENKPKEEQQSYIVNAPDMTLNFDTTRYKTDLLKKDLKGFRASFNYNGAQDKPFYQLYLSTTDVDNGDKDDPFSIHVKLTEDQAADFIDYLANENYLRDAVSGNLPPNGYVLTIQNSTINDATWRYDIKSNLNSFYQLQAMQSILPAECKNAFNSILGRISGLRTKWELEIIKNKPLTINLNGATMHHAVMIDINSALTPSPFKFVINQNKEAANRKIDLQFSDVPVADIITILAREYNWDVNENWQTITLTKKP